MGVIIGIVLVIVVVFIVLRALRKSEKHNPKKPVVRTVDRHKQRLEKSKSDSEPDIEKNLLQYISRKPEFGKAFVNQDKDEMLRLLKEDKDDFIASMAGGSIDAEEIRSKAIRLSLNKKYEEANEVLNQGLLLGLKKEGSSFMFCKAENFLKLNQTKQALSEIENAINSANQHIPNNQYWLGQLIGFRAKVRKELGDNQGWADDLDISSRLKQQDKDISKDQ